MEKEDCQLSPTHCQLEKYNVPVPRYTSYPPANYFTGEFNKELYEELLIISNQEKPEHISFYIHIPFCRHLCHYCGCNSYPMRKEEEINRYVQALHKEIEKVTKLLDNSRKISQIHYGGGSPTILQIATLKELNSHLLSNFQTIEKPEIAIECHPGYLNETYWQGLTEVGFNRFSLGVQDLNKEVLKVVNRRPSLLSLEVIFQILRQKESSINLDLLYGLPLQTKESFSETVEQAISLQPNRVVTFSYGHVPHVNKRQLILEKKGFPTPEEKTAIYETAKNILNTNGYKTIGLDHFVKEDDELYRALKENKLHRNFQGYCTRRTTGQVYAFGVTGISQLQSAYIQNSKNIQEYIEGMDNQTFAIAKGYKLNLNEQITREVIQTLMCNYKIEWQEIANTFSLSIDEIKAAIVYNEQRLTEFVSDGIITCNKDYLQMTPSGSLYVRNVAASFDRLMINNTHYYSKPV